MSVTVLADPAARTLLHCPACACPVPSDQLEGVAVAVLRELGVSPGAGRPRKDGRAQRSAAERGFALHGCRVLARPHRPAGPRPAPPSASSAPRVDAVRSLVAQSAGRPRTSAEVAAIQDGLGDLAAHPGLLERAAGRTLAQSLERARHDALAERGR